MLRTILITLGLSLTFYNQAANITQISRYATVANKPLAAQINPLKTIQHIHFPTSIQTIGEALEYWLRYSGYHLAGKEKQSSSLQLVLQQPLPQVLKTLGPLTIDDGLRVLIGQHLFSLKQDDLLREVNFARISRGAK
jgi:type IV pili sensor histidine kinase/response regulator